MFGSLLNCEYHAVYAKNINTLWHLIFNKICAVNWPNYLCFFCLLTLIIVKINTSAVFVCTCIEMMFWPSEWHGCKMSLCHVNSITHVVAVATQKTPSGYERTFVIIMEIKHQHWAIYLPLRTTHNSTSLLTPEALARPQSILPRAMMPSSGCNIFNNNIAELFSREACCI